MSNTLGIYLAGPCFNEPDEGAAWRQRAKDVLEKTAEDHGCSIKVVNPVNYFSYSEAKHQSDKQVKRYYMDQILHCRLVLVNLENTATSPGTAQELQYAVDHDVQVIGFGSEKVYPWLKVDCQAVFTSLLQAIDYIADYYMN